MSSKSTVDIAYDGPALVGTMDVRQLAPALLMMGALLEDANRVLNGDASKVRVLVKSDFRTGSFEVGLEVIQSLIENAKALFEIGKHTDAVQLLKYVGLAASTSVGLFKLIKWLRGREIESTTAIDNGPMNIVVVEGDHNTIEVDLKVLQLFEDKSVREGVNGLVAPLDRDGIDRLTISSAGKEIETIEKNERPYFAVSRVGPEDIEESIFTFTYRILSPAFEEGFKWRLGDGSNRIWASVKDKVFLQGVDEGKIAFTNGDVIKAKMRAKQSIGPDGVKTEFEVIEVVEHIKRQPFTQPALSETDESP